MAASFPFGPPKQLTQNEGGELAVSVFRRDGERLRPAKKRQRVLEIEVEPPVGDSDDDDAAGVVLRAANFGAPTLPSPK